MKSLYKLILAFSAVPILASAQAPVQDAHNLAQGPGGGSPMFANDVIVAPSGLRQHGTSIAVAFNGWVYVATGVETLDSDSSGGIVRMSRDNGYTWTNFLSYLYPNVDYISPEIEVAGTDTNNLALFIAGAWYDSTGGTADVWVDKYNARNGVFINEVYNESFQYPVRDLDIATDYRYPAYNSSPYSVGLLYSHFGTADSIIFVSSIDGGTTWPNRRGLAGTSLYYDQVSLAFGISSSWNNGRYFAAWEERSSFSATAIGQLKFAHCQTTINGSWTVPFRLDSLDAAIVGNVRRPHIACQYNSTLNNDSSGISVAVTFERAYGGDTADCDILGFYSMSQPNNDFWYRFDIVNNGTQTLQPDIAYDPAYNNFLLTYYSRSAATMPYLVHSFNMANPNTWPVITANYCDQPNTVRNPFPRVAINPALTQAAFSWTRHATADREQAMYDAEYMITAVPSVASTVQLSLYPNPSKDQALLSFNLETADHVRIDIYDLNGRLVMNVFDQSVNSGPQQVSIPAAALANGTYIVSLAAGSIRTTTRLVVAE